VGARATKRRCSVCHSSYTRGEAFCPLDGGAVIADDAASQHDELVGTTIDGRYLISAVLGRGGMGRVYAAEHTGLGKRFALKFVSDASATREQRARFRHEARAASQVVHENVVQIFDVGVDEAGRDFIVMEYVEGRDLGEVIREGPLPPARALAITDQILRGLHVVHEAGIVHRDIKPANIRLTNNADSVKIIDFGIAKSIRSEAAQTETDTGQVIGTPQFMAPEQIIDDAVDRRADLYAVGATLYAMLSGEPPFQSTSLTQRLAAPLPPIGAIPGLPASIAAALERALATDPAARFPDALAFADALAQGRAAVAVRRDEATRPIAYPGALRAPPPTPDAPRPRSLVSIVVVLALMIVVLAGVVIHLLLRVEREPRTVPVVTAAPDAATIATVEAPVDAAATPVDAAPVDAPARVKETPKRTGGSTSAPVAGVATTFIPPPKPLTGPDPYASTCACQFRNAKGSIDHACVQKRSVARCRCRNGSQELCPFVITVIDEGQRKPDGTRGGTMYCVDRTRRECDPLDKAMPKSCWANTVERVAGTPADGAECQGYRSGLAENDPPQRGEWSCDTCDWARTAPKYRGQTTDTCTGFDGHTGEPVSGVLRCY
jgi:serine/threonine-protein kinase